MRYIDWRLLIILIILFLAFFSLRKASYQAGFEDGMATTLAIYNESQNDRAEKARIAEANKWIRHITGGGK